MTPKGERRYVGGPLDGEVERLAYAHNSDYPLGFRYPHHPGGYYERDLDGGTTAVYTWRQDHREETL